MPSKKPVLKPHILVLNTLDTHNPNEHLGRINEEIRQHYL